MVDKSVPYYRVVMKRAQGAALYEHSLPEGMSFVLFEPGDEKEWAEIEAAAGEFERAVDALVYFQTNFLPYLEELKRRCLFIETKDGEKIATLTVWWCYTGVRRDLRLHWVAVRPEYQGLGLGKAIVAEGLKRLAAIEGDRDIYLVTQTWSYKAIGLYQKAGFEITDEQGVAGRDNSEYKKAKAVLEKYLR